MRMMKFFAAVVFGLVVLSSISFGATYGGGSGTAVDPYQIWTPQQMNTIGANSGDWGKCFILMADVDMSIYTGAQYNIIGNLAIKFNGTFNGNSHIIRNLTWITYASTTYAGLFGYITNATIKNMGIENVNLYVGSNSDQGLVRCFVGGLVGYQDHSIIINCHSTGVVQSSSSSVGPPPFSYSGGLVGYQNYGIITNCYSTNIVRSLSDGFYASSYSGGLVGYQNHGVIIDCYSTGDISSYSFSYESCFSYAGGLVGEQNEYSTILNCYSTGPVTSSADSPASSDEYLAASTSAGGLVGCQDNYGTITNSYSTGSVSSSTSWPSYSSVGGLVGANSYCTITNCYSTGTVSSSAPDSASESSIGGLVGANNFGTVTNCYSTGSVIFYVSQSYAGGIVGSNYSCIYISCFWDIQTSGKTIGFGWNPSAGTTGKTTDEMKTLSTFTGWDFTNETANGTNNVWRMCADGMDYPRLNWESIEADFICPDGVSSEDLGHFVGQWLLNNCTINNNYCSRVDMNTSGKVDLADFAVLAGHWLEGV